MGIFRSDCRWAIRIVHERKHDLDPRLSWYVPLTTILLYAKRTGSGKSVVRLRYWGDCHRMVAEYKRSLPTSRQGMTYQSKISYSILVPPPVWYKMIRPFLVTILQCRVKDKLRATFFRGRARITVDYKLRGPGCIEIKVPVRSDTSLPGSTIPAFS